MSSETILEKDISADKLEQILIKAHAHYERDEDNDFHTRTPSGNGIIISYLPDVRMIRFFSSLRLAKKIARQISIELANKLNNEYAFATFAVGQRHEIVLIKCFLLCWDWIVDTQVIKHIIHLDSVINDVKKELEKRLVVAAVEAAARNDGKYEMDIR